MDIGSLTGQIELDDAFSSALRKVSDQVLDFTTKFAVTLGPVGAALGIVTAGATAFGAAAVTAISSLASKGADVNDIASTFENFSGSTEKAAANLKALETGTLETVNKLDLMKASSKLLAAGVKLTSDQFGTLGSAAFVLQNQGLGPTKQVLDLLSQSLLTGRTRALEMKIGKIDLAKAEREYAASLGVEKLDQMQKVEAHREGILAKLNEKVKDAGVQHRDFGEQLEFAKAKFDNFLDDLASAIAKSPVLAAGMDAVADALEAAFGSGNKDLLKTVVGLVESLTIGTVNLGIAAIETARVFHTAWSGLEVIVLGLTTAITGNVMAFAMANAKIADIAASIPGATDGMKSYAASSQAAADAAKAMTLGLFEETKEAARGVVGHSEFDKTLDRIGGTLFTVRDAMKEAQKHTEALTNATVKHGSGVRNTTDALEDQNKALKEHQAWLKEQQVLEGKFLMQEAEAQNKGYADLRKLREQFDDAIAQRTMKSVAYQNYLNDQWAKHTKDNFIGSADAAEAYYDLVDRLAIIQQQLPLIKPDYLKGLSGEIEGLWISEAQDLGSTFSIAFKDSLQHTFESIPDILRSAFEGGGGISGAMKSIAIKIGQDFANAMSLAIKEQLDKNGEGYTGSAISGKTIGLAAGTGALAGFGAVASGASTGKQVGAVGSAALGVGLSTYAATGGAIAATAATAAFTAGAGLAVVAAFKLYKAMNDGRKAMQDYYKTFTGGSDELRQKMLVLGDAGEALWIKLTQQTGKGDKKGAQNVIAQINEALANSPAALAAAAGYQTKEDLQSVADKAKQVYDYMVSSGKYTASAIADAFEKSKEAQLAALSDEGRAHQDALDEIANRYKEMFDKLDTEYKSLSDSVAGEAEEELMGVVEMQQRARMKQIEAEKSALEDKQANEMSAAEETYQAWLAAGKTTDAALREIFTKPYDIPIHWKIDDPLYMAGGGIVPGTPRGTDTVPAMLTPGETVIPAGRSNRLEGVVEVPLIVNDEVLARAVVRVAKRL